MPRSCAGPVGALLVLGLLALCASEAAAQYDYKWRNGRASFYGKDAWSIHKGSCGFGYIFPDQPAGWDTAALSDKFPGFDGSCGRCYEVKCNPVTVRDGYGKTFDRTHVCLDPTASLLIRTVDACPCHFPGNYYSNKRWCCGDQDHMDLSIWAFEKLAEKKWGVIGIQYRAVPCSYQPAKPAPAIAKPTPGDKAPKGKESFIKTGDMKTPKIWSSQQTPVVVQGWHFGDPTGSSSDPLPTSGSGSASARASASASSGGGSASASASASAFGSASASASSSSATGSSDSGSAAAWATAAASSGGATMAAGDLAKALGMFGVHSYEGPATDRAGQNATATASAAAAASSSDASPAAGNKGVIFMNGLQNGWRDASNKAQVSWQAGKFGADSGGVVCAEIKPGGALAVEHSPGAFVGATSLEWRMKIDGQRPPLSVNIGGSSKYCAPLSLKGLSVLDKRGSWSRFSIHMADFGGSYSSFAGCGGRQAKELTTVEFKNSGKGQQKVCFDSMRLLASAGSS